MIILKKDYFMILEIIPNAIHVHISNAPELSPLKKSNTFRFLFRDKCKYICFRSIETKILNITYHVLNQNIAFPNISLCVRVWIPAGDSHFRWSLKAASVWWERLVCWLSRSFGFNVAAAGKGANSLSSTSSAVNMPVARLSFNVKFPSKP